MGHADLLTPTRCSAGARSSVVRVSCGSHSVPRWGESLACRRHRAPRERARGAARVVEWAGGVRSPRPKAVRPARKCRITDGKGVRTRAGRRRVPPGSNHRWRDPRDLAANRHPRLAPLRPEPVGGAVAPASGKSARTAAPSCVREDHRGARPQEPSLGQRRGDLGGFRWKWKTRSGGTRVSVDPVGEIAAPRMQTAHLPYGSPSRAWMTRASATVPGGRWRGCPRDQSHCARRADSRPAVATSQSTPASSRSAGTSS